VHSDFQLLIADCGEAVPALRPAGILPAVENKGNPASLPDRHGANCKSKILSDLVSL
jgi:hypothetical protein